MKNEAIISTTGSRRAHLNAVSPGPGYCSQYNISAQTNVTANPWADASRRKRTGCVVGELL